MILAERKVSLLNGELIVTSEKIDTVNGIKEDDTIPQNKLEEILEFLASTEILSFVNTFINEISLSGSQELIDLYAKNNFQGNYIITHENKHLKIEVTHKSQSIICTFIRTQLQGAIQGELTQPCTGKTELKC